MVAVSPIQRLRGQDVRVEAGCLRGRLPSMVTWNCAPARQRSVRRRNVIVGGRWQAMPSVVSWIKGPPSPVLAPVVAPAEHAGYVFVCVRARERACLCFYECMHACVQLTAFH